MPLVQVFLRHGRSAEDLHRLGAKVTDAVCDALGVAGASVRVLINEVPANHWYVDGRPIGPPPDPYQDKSQ